MHPAKSVIFFTTFSGAGYGLLSVSILGYLFGLYQSSSTIILLCMGLAFMMVTAGLLSSTLHLGHPERAWRALSQWRTSWLSREGLAALMTFLPWSLFSVLVVFEVGNTILFWVGLTTVWLALFTVYTTSMIYRSLKAIHAWFNVYVSPLYLLFSITTGLVILNLILFVFNSPSEKINNLALVTLILTLLLKRAYWRSLTIKSVTNLGTATGLGDMGEVKSLEPPHHGDNYLLKEMGFRIARKHSQKLRNIFSICWVISVIAIALTLVFDGIFMVILAVIALLAMAIGVAIERWLFFAEAKHSQALYYGH